MGCVMQEENVVGAVAAMSLQDKKDQLREIWQRFRSFDEFCLPYPTVLVGAGTALWDNVKRDICPGCNNRPLKPNEFCLRCDSWGLDKFLQNHLVKIMTYRERAVPISNKVTRRNTESVAV
jgi:hypothetical protein